MSSLESELKKAWPKGVTIPKFLILYIKNLKRAERDKHWIIAAECYRRGWAWNEFLVHSAKLNKEDDEA